MTIAAIAPISGSPSAAAAIAALSPYARARALERAQGTRQNAAAAAAQAQALAQARTALAAQANGGSALVAATAFPPVSPLTVIAQLAAIVPLTPSLAASSAPSSGSASFPGTVSASGDTVVGAPTTGSIAAASIDPSSQSALYAQAYAIAAASYAKLPVVPPALAPLPVVPAAAPVARVASYAGSPGSLLDRTA
jgi:hypothetical protein